MNLLSDLKYVTLCFVAVTALAAAPANAITMRTTYVGHVGAGSTDSVDYFGQGTALEAQPFTLSYLWDTANVSSVVQTGPLDGSAFGYLYFEPNAFQFSFDLGAFHSDFNFLPSTSVQDNRQGSPSFFFNQTTFFGHLNSAFSINLHVISSNANSLAFGLLDSFFEKNLDHIGNIGDSYVFSNGAIVSSFWLDADSVKVTSVSSVPLPAAFPLFATGLLGLGIFGRKRRNTKIKAVL
jgi:hypothetical protein